jgi:hypothetical protein
MTTQELEFGIFNTLKKLGTYLCFEVKMPTSNERVDLLTLSSKGVWKFYELKISKSDFNSKCKHTFLGHFNYYVMPLELYNSVKNKIPSHIGCYVLSDGARTCYSVKKAKSQELKVEHNKLIIAFIQGLSREHEKYRAFLKREHNKKKEKEKRATKKNNKV